MKKALLSLFAAASLFAAGTPSAFADVTLFSTDFSGAEWSSYTAESPIKAKTTVNGIYFTNACYTANDALYFVGGNMGSSRYAAIKLSDINKQFTVTLTFNTSAKVNWDVIEGTTYGSPVRKDDTAGETQVITYNMEGKGTDAVFYFYQQGSKIANIVKTITITTPEASGKSDPNFSLTQSEASIEKGTSTTITYNNEGNGSVSFLSSNDNVATVTPEGVVTATGIGNATITVTAAETDTYDGATKSFAVSVPGEIFTYDGFASFNGALSTTNLTASIVESSGATSDFNSKYTGSFGGITFSSGLKMQGSTTVNFTTTGKADIQIVQSVASAEKDVRAVLDAAGSALSTDYGISQYYFVDQANKVRIYTIKDVEAGDHTITRTAEWGLLYVGVKYTELAEANLTITSATSLDLDISETATIQYTTDSNAPVSFESSNKQVADVDENGLITPVAIGTTTITIKQPTTNAFSAGEATVEVTVSDKAVSFALDVVGTGTPGGSTVFSSGLVTLKNSYTPKTNTNFFKIAPVQGEFQKGDVVSLSAYYNNGDATRGNGVGIYQNGVLVYASELLNNKADGAEASELTYTLKSNASYLLIARTSVENRSATTTYVSGITVRKSEESTDYHEYTRTINDKYATIYLNFDAAVPAGLVAYLPTSVQDNGGSQTMLLTEIDGIPANTGVVVALGEGAAKGDYIFADGSVSVNSTSILTGTFEDIALPAGAFYLGKDVDGNYIFGSFAGSTSYNFLEANKAYYLPANGKSENIRLVFDEAVTTGISKVATATVSGEAFDLNGRRAGNKGLHIVDGKVTLIK